MCVCDLYVFNWGFKKIEINLLNIQNGFNWIDLINNSDSFFFYYYYYYSGLALGHWDLPAHSQFSCVLKEAKSHKLGRCFIQENGAAQVWRDGCCAHNPRKSQALWSCAGQQRQVDPRDSLTSHLNYPTYSRFRESSASENKVNIWRKDMPD